MGQCMFQMLDLILLFALAYSAIPLALLALPMISISVNIRAGPNDVQFHTQKWNANYLSNCNAFAHVFEQAFFVTATGISL